MPGGDGGLSGGGDRGRRRRHVSGGRGARRHSRDTARARVLREWRGADEPLDPGRNISRAGDLLRQVLGGLRLEEGLEEDRLREAWREIAGEFIARHTQPVSLRNGRLVLRVLQPSMRFHLEQSRVQLLERLREHFGAGTIREVRLGIG